LLQQLTANNVLARRLSARKDEWTWARVNGIGLIERVAVW